MDVVSACPLPVASFVWRPGAGGFVLTVVCKATFRLAPGRSPLAAQQDPPHQADVPWDGDPRRSLYAPSDLVPFKRRADVIVVGHAFAPLAAPARSLLARVQVAELDKAIEVHADRAFARDGTLIEGPRFPSMSLDWERAAGGPDTLNPAGMRFDAAPDRYGRIPIPNLQPPRKRVAARGDTFAPAGFGPFSPAWPRRVHMLHRHAKTWSHARWFERPLPEDVGPGYFNAAPPDQQIDALPPEVEITLEHLHAEHPRLVTRLSQVFPRATVERHGGTAETIVLACDTLWIDTDRGVAALVWRGSVRLSHPNDAGRAVVWAEGEGLRDLAPPAKALEIEAIDDEETLRPDARDDAPAYVRGELLTEVLAEDLAAEDLAGEDLDDAPTPQGPVKLARIPTQASLPDAPRAEPLPFRSGDAPRRADAQPEVSSLGRTTAGPLHGGAPLRSTRTLPMPRPPQRTPPMTKPATGTLPMTKPATGTLPMTKPADPPAVAAFDSNETLPLKQEATGVIRPDDLDRKGPTLPFGKRADRAAARSALGAPFKAPPAAPRFGPPPEETPRIEAPRIEPARTEERTALVDLAALVGQGAPLPFVPAPDDLDAETHADGPATVPRPEIRDEGPPLSLTATAIPAVRSVDLPFAREAAGIVETPSIEPIPSLARAPMPAASAVSWSPAPEVSAPRPKAEPEAAPLSVDDYASVKIAFWSKDAGSHAAVEDTLRELAIDEDAWRAGEERLLAQLAEEAGRGETRLARALRAAMKRALGAAQEAAAPGLPSLRAG